MTELDNLASFPIRVGAYLMDVIIPFAGFLLFAFGVVSVVFFITSEFAYGITRLDDHDAEPRHGLPVWIIPLILAGAVIVIGYFVWWLIALKDGQTPGKKIVGIRAVSAHSGETLGWGMMLVRELLAKSVLFAVIFELTPIGTFLDFFFLPFDIFNAFGVLGFLPLGVVFLLVNFLWPIWDANSQTLHDKIVGTLVVRA